MRRRIRDMAEKNRFSLLLEQLMNTAEVKNAGLARALQYDVSYIGKWVSGRMLPTEKIKRKILKGISGEIVRQGSEDGIKVLCNNYRVETPEELQIAIFDHLEAEYDYVLEQQKTYGMAEAPKTVFFAELSPNQYLTRMRHPALRRVWLLHIVAAMDLFSVTNEYRLRIVKGEGRREGKWTYPNVHFSLMVDFDLNKIKYPNDPIFLLNMLSEMSVVDFQLYEGDQAAGRMVYVVKDDFMISGMLMSPEQCMAVVVSSSAEYCNPMYRRLRELCTREMLLFRKTDMLEMVKGHDYEYSILSLNRRWILGHATEHFLSESMFEELLQEMCSGKESYFDKERLRQIHALNRKALEETKLDIILYGTALSNLAVEGELDFFDHKMKLNLRQRSKYLQYLLEALMERSNLQFKVICGELITDFQYDKTQCVFLSDSISYVRLNAEESLSNLLIVNHMDVQTVFEQFFNYIWEDESGKILSEKDKIRIFVEHVIQSVMILADIAQ